MNDIYILWRRVDAPGHEACRLRRESDGWSLRGCANYRDDSGFGALSYRVEHDENWLTRNAQVTGWAGNHELDLQIVRNSDGTWFCNDNLMDSLKGCTDIDLGFTPATNTTAIRRLNLEIGQEQQANAAWLDTEDWRLKPLAQTYARVSRTSYRYASSDHGYRTELTVSENGLVTVYPRLWVSDGKGHLSVPAAHQK